MLGPARLILLLMILTPEIQATDSVADLQERVDRLTQEIALLQQAMQEIRSSKDGPDGEVEAGSLSAPLPVDLSQQELPAIDGQHETNVLARPWWRNFELYGFGAGGFYDTGQAGTRDNGGFEVKEATLFFEADVWEEVGFFLELQTNRLGKDDQVYTRTGEVYTHFRHFIGSGDSPVGLKLGRIDIPFGEEYLWQDAIDNPLITNSAAYPYGWDEGVLIYGEFGRLNWIAAVTDGTDARSIEENSDKAINLKLYGHPTDELYLSASFMANGDNTKSAVEFGGSHFQPVGAGRQSTLGASTSEQVSSNLLQVDAKYELDIAGRNGYVSVSAGGAEQNDRQSIFDRDLYWYSIEPFLKINRAWYAVLRFSEIGTTDKDEGYHFDGKTFAGGNDAFGYDTNRFRRLGLGVGWMPNPRTRAKLEIGKDWFRLIEESPLETDNSDRNFIGLEMAVGF